MAMSERGYDDNEELQDFKEAEYTNYELDQAWQTVYIRSLDDHLFKLISNRLTYDELETHLRDWISDKPSAANVFATAFSRARDTDLYRALDGWERKTSPFLGIQALLSPEQFKRFLKHIYGGQAVPNFDNFDPKRKKAREMSSGRRGADPGLIMKRF